MQHLADLVSKQLTEKQKEDEEEPKIIKSKNIIFGCTGTIGEKFPEDKIKFKIPELIKNIKYTQNKYIDESCFRNHDYWHTTKMAMEECKIEAPVKI